MKSIETLEKLFSLADSFVSEDAPSSIYPFASICETGEIAEATTRDYLLERLNDSNKEDTMCLLFYAKDDKWFLESEPYFTKGE